MKKLYLLFISLAMVCFNCFAVTVQGEESAGVYLNLRSTTGILQIYNQTWGVANITYLTSAARTTSQTQADQTNTLAHGLYVFCNVSVVPGVDTVQVVVEGKDSLSSAYYTIAATTATAVTGLIVVKVSPYLAPVAAAVTGIAVNEYLPATWRIKVVHSAATSFTYSCSYNTTAN